MQGEAGHHVEIGGRAGIQRNRGVAAAFSRPIPLVLRQGEAGEGKAAVAEVAGLVERRGVPAGLIARIERTGGIILVEALVAQEIGVIGSGQSSFGAGGSNANIGTGRFGRAAEILRRGGIGRRAIVTDAAEAEAAAGE